MKIFRSTSGALLLVIACLLPSLGVTAPSKVSLSSLGSASLVVAKASERDAVLPADSRHLIRPEAIEVFLTALEETRPDWTVVYGRGHLDADFDARLFQLNRARDKKRRERTAVAGPVTFIWTGRLSAYDAARDGFPVAVGPELIRTTWGVVRFKPAELPPNLTACASESLRARLIERMNAGSPVDIQVAMTGHLITGESVIYDFSHDQEGQGMIMPVVNVERIDYLLIE